eukprot:COSAG02_NODE_4857_length_4897_cov_5.098166_1_plen_43_part_00
MAISIIPLFFSLFNPQTPPRAPAAGSSLRFIDHARRTPFYSF